VTEAITRAQHWLLSTQRDDGSWPIDISHISKIDRSAPAKRKTLKNAIDIYTYWGTAWATIGLLQAVPNCAQRRALTVALSAGRKDACCDRPQEIHAATRAGR